MRRQMERRRVGGLRGRAGRGVVKNDRCAAREGVGGRRFRQLGIAGRGIPEGVRRGCDLAYVGLRDAHVRAVSVLERDAS